MFIYNSNQLWVLCHFLGERDWLIRGRGDYWLWQTGGNAPCMRREETGWLSPRWRRRTEYKGESVDQCGKFAWEVNHTKKSTISTMRKYFIAGEKHLEERRNIGAGGVGPPVMGWNLHECREILYFRRVIEKEEIEKIINTERLRNSRFPRKETGKNE